MDMYPNATAWLQQHQQHQQQQQHQQHPPPPPPPLHVEPQQRPSSTDWKDPSTSSGNATTPSAAQPTIDLSDFGLGDLSGPSSSSPLSNPSFFPFSNNFFLSNLSSSPYNAMNYGNSSWPNAQGSVPLSSYSTLNGATTSTAPVQQQQPPAQQAVIDPALTTINHPQMYSPPNISSQSPPPPPPPQHTSSQYSYSHLQTPSLSMSYPTSYQPTHQQQQQHQQQPQQQQQQQPQYQGTLSPYALQSPPPPTMSTISPSSFYGMHTSVPSASSTASASAAALAQAEARRKQFLAAVKNQTQPKDFSGAGGVRRLVSLIADYGITEVDAATRQEIVTKVRDCAGNHYFRAWSENSTAMEIMREWLKAGATAGEGEANPYSENVMPLLHIADRLPFTYETITSSKLGKVVRKIGKETSIPAVKDMASNLERKWRELFVNSRPSKDQPMLVDEDSQDGKSKKRKSAEPPSKGAPPAKKAAVGAASSSKPAAVKREIKPVPATKVKDSKSDSSFFSAPKPKPKLPSFKKSPAPATVKKEPDPNVAQPSAIDPFQEALKDMAKARKASPVVVPTPPPAPASVGTPPPQAAFTKSGKKRKSVTWAADGQLEQVKLIDRAVYDDDPLDGMHTSHNLRDLDRDEGAALHAHLFEELIDWSEPLSLAFPPDAEPRPRGEDSQEKVTQEQRELTALAALYPAQIPDSPAEPAVQLPPDQVDAHVRLMLTGPDVDALFWQQSPAGGPEQPPQPGASVSDLVGQLAAPAAADPAALAFDPALLAQVASMGSIPPEQLQQIAALLAQQPQPQPQPPDGEQQHAWGADAGFPDAAGRGRWGEGGAWRARGGRGRGGGGGGAGRGRGQGRSRVACSFFAQGRCKYGDQCDFSHDPQY